MVAAQSCCLEMLLCSVVWMADQASRMAVGGWSVPLYRALMNFWAQQPGLARGFQDKWDQVDVGISVKLFLFLAFGHEARAGAGR